MSLLQRIQSLDASRRLDVIQKYIPVLLIDKNNLMSGEDDAIVVGHIHSNLVESIRNKLNGMGDNKRVFYKYSFLLPSVLPATSAADIDDDDDQSSSLTCRNRFFGLLVDDQSSAQNLVDARNIIFERFTDLLLDCNIITKRHTDMYPVTDIKKKMVVLPEVDRGEEEIIATINRMAAPFLGITSVGIHLLCYVFDKNKNNISLWLAQRAANKSHYPLYWDPTVAGGQPVDIKLFQNVIKEAGEEAGINTESVIQNAVSTGCLSQMTCKPNGTCMKQSLYYTWDMQVYRETFVPKSVDGEVATFELCTEQKLEYEIRYGNRLRPAMILVVTDFLIRHGVITPLNEPDYKKIQIAIHRERLVLDYVPQGK